VVYRVDYKPRREGSFGDRPKRDFGDRPAPQREGGFGDRPKRSFGGEDRPKRSFGGEDRPKRKFGEDRPVRGTREETFGGDRRRKNDF
jgi:hypothetical protein